MKKIQRTCLLIILATYLIAHHFPIIASALNFDKFLYYHGVGQTRLKFENETTYCSFNIGCIDKLPNTADPSGPEVLKTQFKISTANEATIVTINDAGTCPLSVAKICPYDLTTLRSSPFRPDRRTVIIITGYSNHRECWSCTMADVWHRLDVNVIRVHWNTQGYSIAVANTKFLARQITLLIYYLARVHEVEINESYLENIYLIGYSLGAHVAGFVGKDYEGRLGRITGLEPAGRSFLTSSPQHRLDRSDALFVDVIHTNAGRSGIHWGTLVDSGHVDLYANDGKDQPGCLSANIYRSLYCSHSAAINYYLTILSNSIDGLEPCLAYGSDNYEDFSNGRSFEKFCRISSMQDKIPDHSHRCSIPIDYLASSSEYRELLTETFRLNLNETNRFYFLTSDSESHPKYNYLLQMNIRKDLSAEKAVEFGCDFSVEFVMKDGTTKSKSRFSQYKLLQHTEKLYKLLIPFVIASPNQYESDYKAEDIARFPYKIVVSGLTENGRDGSWSSMVANKMRSAWNILKSIGTRMSPTCDLSIESVSVHLMKMSPVSAHYSLKEKGYHMLIESDNPHDTRIELDHDETKRTSHFYLSDVVSRKKTDSIYKV